MIGSRSRSISEHTTGVPAGEMLISSTVLTVVTRELTRSVANSFGQEKTDTDCCLALGIRFWGDSAGAVSMLVLDVREPQIIPGEETFEPVVRRGTA